MNSVLFVCTGNMYRSPIAAEVFRSALAQIGKDMDWHIDSAGTWTVEGKPIPPQAAQIARALGVQVEGHKTRMLNRQMMEEYDLILVMEHGHLEALRAEFPFAQNKVRLLSEVLSGFGYDIPDPAASPLEAQNILQEMSNMIRHGAANIYNAAMQHNTE